FLQAQLAAAFQDLLERRNEGFGAVEAETLGAGEFLVAEALEGLGSDQPLIDGALAHDREVGAVEAAFDAFLQPGALLGILDMHVFDADRARIGRAHASQDIAERERLLAEHGVDEDRSAEIGLGEAVMADLELGMRLRGLEAERIEVGLEMAAGAVVADELEGARGVEDSAAR